MLSKLRHYARPHDKNTTAPVCKSAANLSAYFGGRVSDLRLVNGGTLGAGFLGQLDGRCRFFKTHSYVDGAEALEKEIFLLTRAFNSRLNIETVGSKKAGPFKRWIIMDQLYPPGSPPGIEDILALEEQKAEWFPDQYQLGEPARGDDLLFLIDEGAAAAKRLAAKGFLSDNIYAALHPRLNELKAEEKKINRVVCHGDLSPSNLLIDASGILPVDWEDAFWGFIGYDYLYWLTFFENRKFYSNEILGRTVLGKDLEIAILLMIIVLKSDLSVRSNTYRLNSLSFDERLTEILDLAGG